MGFAADSHVHTQWSWDAANGAMVESCQRAIELGVPAIAFTEHVDHTVWNVAMERVAPDHPLALLAQDGQLHPPAFDALGYLAMAAECRDRFPELRILTGLELGEPHRHGPQVAQVLAAGDFDRLLGSVHSLADGHGFTEPAALFRDHDPAQVVRAYLAEVAELMSSDAPCQVLAHVDYPVRHWPAAAREFDPGAFEDEFRHVLRVTAESGRALEVNTRLPLHATILSWWRDEGGTAITFGSDAHEPDSIAKGFREAQQMAEAHGFRPGAAPHEFWGRA